MKLRKNIFSILVISLTIMEISCGNNTKFHVRDFYIDSSESGKFVNMFIETKITDSTMLMKFADDIKKDPRYSHTSSDTSFCLFKLMFFNPRDAERFSPLVLKNIFYRTDSLAIIELSQKTRFVANAYTYVGYSGNGNDVTIPRAHLSRNDIFVPDEGVKSLEIMKIMKR